MSGHRRHYRRRRSPESSPSRSRSTSRRSSMRDSTSETDDGGHRRRHKRSSASSSLPVRRRSPSPPHRIRSWALLHRPGVRQGDSRRDSATSAKSRTCRGEEIAVSFELVEPPGTSVLTFDCRPPAASLTTTTAAPRKYSAKVVAAHRDVVLLAIKSHEDKPEGHWWDTRTCFVDLFVYHHARGGGGGDDPSRRRRRRRQPSLLLLPYAGELVAYPHRLCSGEIGILSCGATSSDDDGCSPPSFVVAELRMRRDKGTIDIVRLFRPESGQWVSFRDLYVRGAYGGGELQWWSTDAVVPYGRRRMIWIDYYRGMVIMDLSGSHPPATATRTPPRFRYVPLPVDKVEDPEDREFGSRACPKPWRRVCVTRHGVKFVSVDTQHRSSFGVGSRNVLRWSRRFRITTWWLREHDDGGDYYTWRRDARMDEEEFWDALDDGAGGDRLPSFPHVVQPRFPVVDVENPDVVVFRMEDPLRCRRDKEPVWMVEVDLRKKVLLAATAYSNEETDDAEDDINSVRMESRFDPVPSELPRYLDVAGQARKKRRQ